MGIALGLGAALSWGLADYFAAVASRRAGALRVVLGFHLAALIPLTVLVLATGALARVSVAEVWVLVGVGAVGWLSYLAFYGALAIGPISVLSPIVSGYAAVTALLAVAFAGSHLSAMQAVAVAITIGGAMLASADVKEILRAKLRRRSVLGVVLALCAMVLLGAFVFGVSYYRRRIGWLGPIFLARGFATLFLLGHVLATSARASGSRGEPHAIGGEDGGLRIAPGCGCMRSWPYWRCWTPAATCASTSARGTPRRRSWRRPRRRTRWCRSPWGSRSYGNVPQAPNGWAWHVSWWGVVLGVVT